MERHAAKSELDLASFEPETLTQNFSALPLDHQTLLMNLLAAYKSMWCISTSMFYDH
jgi:hypothetical protein